MAGLGTTIRYQARAHLAGGLGVSAGLIVTAAALLFLVQLSTLNDSSRAASELSDLRTYAQQVALAAELTGHDGDISRLENSILDAEVQGSRLGEYLDHVLGETESTRIQGEVDAAWDGTVAASRAFVLGNVEFEAVVDAADDTAIAVDDALAILTTRSEGRTQQLRSALQGSVVLLILGALASAGAVLRQRRRASEVDALTGVLARDRFRSQLALALLNSHRSSDTAVAVIDVDRFRRINDTLGAEQGDRVLRDVARRIQDALPRDASVGRRGGDEFLVLLPGQDAEEARATAQTILGALDQPLVYQTGELRAGVSIGLAVAPRDGVDAKVLLEAADGARDDAKVDGGGTYRFARGGSATAVGGDALALEVELRRALERDQFELYYQPQISVATGEIVGAEALLRWHSPERGLVAPDRFIPLLEESRLIVPVGSWAIREAAVQANEWLQLRDQPFRIAVNVSARQLFQSDLVATVRDALEVSGLPPTSLELEVTETVAIQNPDEAVRILEAIAALGVQSALDDFGTGHSWLTHLKLLPKMSLKIDRSFVSGITKNAEDRAIVAGLVTVAHTLQRTVVAEGVERAAELAMLEEMRCDIAQGFYFSRAVPAAEFRELLLREHSWAPSTAVA